MGLLGEASGLTVSAGIAHTIRPATAHPVNASSGLVRLRHKEPGSRVVTVIPGQSSMRSRERLRVGD